MTSETEPTLLILGSLHDAHVARVVARIRAQLALRIAVIDFLQPACATLHMDCLGQHRLEVGGTAVVAPLLVWDRVKIVPGTGLYPAGEPREAEYVAQEWIGFYQAVRELYRDVLVNPLASRQASTKLRQQALAAQQGFSVPPSLLANEKSPLLCFQAAQSGHVIMKSVAGRPLRPPPEHKVAVVYHVMTMRLGECDLADADPASLSGCPHFIQAEIAKDHELRVVVAGNQLRAFRVCSQESPLSEVDWRKGMQVVRFEACALEPALQHRLFGFMRAAGLVFGSIDLIVDRHGDVWFLECNPDGAWGWLDDLVDGAVADLIAGYLVQQLRERGAPLLPVAVPA